MKDKLPTICQADKMPAMRDNDIYTGWTVNTYLLMVSRNVINFLCEEAEYNQFS